MNFTWMDLVRYLEVTALVMSASLLLARPLPMPDARQRLRFLYLTLFACLVAPLCVVQHERQVVSLSSTPIRYESIEIVDTRDGTVFVERPLMTLWRRVGPVPRWMLFIASLRILWLCVGLIRLSLYRRRARLLMPLPEHLREMRTRQRVDAQLYLSSDVNGPVTFGFVSPVVLLPLYFREIGKAQQSAAVCHELAHVRRNDAVAVFAEEVLRSLLWFHPLVWWLLDRIQLCREQVVDAETIAITEDRGTYLETLLAFAQRTAIPDLAPATPFLKRNHLVERMRSIAKEANMPERIKRLNAAALYTLTPCVLALGIWLLPLQGQPELVRDTPGIVIDPAYPLLHRGPVEMPAQVIAAKTAGEVVVSVTVGASGDVTDARVVSGPTEMQPSVLRSIRGWHFDTEHAVPPKQFEVRVRFDPLTQPARSSAGRAKALGPDLYRIVGEQVAQADWIRVRGRCPDACAELESADFLIKADEIAYNKSTEDVEARGHVCYENLKVGVTKTADRAEYQSSGQRWLFDGKLAFGDAGAPTTLKTTERPRAIGPSGSEPLKVTRIDASALPLDVRERALQVLGIQAGDAITQLETMKKLKDLAAAEPKLQFAWGSPSAGTIEIYLTPRGDRPPVASLSAPSSIRITGVDASALPEPLRQRVLDRLNIHEGDSLTGEELSSKQAAVLEIDRHIAFLRQDTQSFDPQNVRLKLMIESKTPGEPPPSPRVQFAPGAPQPVYTLTPVYPPLAVQARIQGTVRYTVIIGADGLVKNIQLISGHPLMVPSSVDALKQFRFEPTGAEVKTTADVHFTLSQ